MLIRYADDFVVAFQYRHEARAFPNVDPQAEEIQPESRTREDRPETFQSLSPQPTPLL